MRTIGPFVPPGDGSEAHEAADADEGYSMWWAVEGRGRKGVTLDLRRTEGQELFRRLVSRSDVVCENFRPGTLEGWNVGPESCDPKVIWARISVFGQDGPYSDRPGLDRMGIAYGGLLAITGYPDRPPVRPGVTISDYLTGTFAAEAALAALYRRDRPGRGTGRGGVIDASLYGAVLRVLEWTIAGQDRLGVTRERQGNRLANSAPLDNYATADGSFVCIVAGSDANFRRLCPGDGPARTGRRSPMVDPEATGRGRRHHQRVGGRLGRRPGRGRSRGALRGERRPGGMPTTPPRSSPTRTWPLGATWCEWRIPWPDHTCSKRRSHASTATDPRLHVPPGLGEHNREVWCDLVGLDDEAFLAHRGREPSQSHRARPADGAPGVGERGEPIRPARRRGHRRCFPGQRGCPFRWLLTSPFPRAVAKWLKASSHP